jgi:hypothetical protein
MLMKKRIEFDVLPVTKWFLLAIIASITVAMTGCKDDDDDTVDVRLYTISGDADASQVSDTTVSTGTGTISGTYNPNTRVLTYSSDWNELSGAPTSAGFYNGEAGVFGTAVGAPWTIDAAATGTGTASGTVTLTTDQAAQLISGGMYYLYGTAANPDGEIRGQISAER